MAEGSANILVVEDEYIVAKDIRNRLINLGYTVPAIVATGEEALRKTEEFKPDLVLMDIVLKGDKDGIETADEIKTRYNLPVIYLTAYTDDKTIQRAKLTEPFGYIIKPFEERELYSTIEMALYKQKMEKKLKVSEERYRRLVEYFPEPMVVYSQGKMVYINPAGIELFSAARSEELLGKSIIDFIHPDHQAEISARIHETEFEQQPHKAIRIKIKLISLDGQEKEVELSAIPITYLEKNATQIVLKDITKTRSIEEELKDSEEKFRNLVERAKDGVVIIQDEKIKYANPRLEEITGYNAEDVIDTQFTTYLAPDKVTMVVDRYKRRMAGEYVEPVYESTILHKNGNRIDVEINGGVSIYRGKPANFVYVHDITERKQVEEALRESEEKYRRLIGTSPDTIIYSDLNGKIIMVNTQALKVYGYETEEELIGKNVFEFIAPEDRDRAVEVVQQILDKGEIRNSQYKLLRKDGTIFHGEISSSLIRDIEANPKGIISVVRDISERFLITKALRESEEKYRKLFNRSNDSIIVHDLEGNILDINQKGLDTFGYDKTEFLSLNVGAIHPPEALERSKLAFETIIKDGSITFEIDFLTKTGDVFHAEVSSSIYEQGDKKVIQGIIRDISNREK